MCLHFRMTLCTFPRNSCLFLFIFKNYNLWLFSVELLQLPDYLCIVESLGDIITLFFSFYCPHRRPFRSLSSSPPATASQLSIYLATASTRTRRDRNIDACTIIRRLVKPVRGRDGRASCRYAFCSLVAANALEICKNRLSTTRNTLYDVLLHGSGAWCCALLLLYCTQYNV